MLYNTKYTELDSQVFAFYCFFCINIEADPQLETLLEKYRHESTIKHKSLKCLFTGPPRVGKTTLKKRLLRVIKNLISSGVISPSGGLERPISVVIGETRECVTVVMESDIDWKPQHELLDEAQIVLQFIDQHPTTPHLPPPTHALSHAKGLVRVSLHDHTFGVALPPSLFHLLQ